MLKPPSAFAAPSFGRSVVIGCGLMILMLGLDASVNFHNIRALNENAERVAHTHYIEQMASDCLSSTFDSVLNHRGYVFRGFAPSLEGYQASKARVQTLLRDLRQAVSDLPDQMARVEQLSLQINELLDELEAQLELQKNGMSRSQLLELLDSPHSRLDSIRELVKQLRERSEGLLAQREILHRNSYSGALVFALVSLVLGIAVFLGIIELVRRQLEERLREQQRLSHVIDSMYAFVGILNPEGILVEANRVPLEDSGLQRDEVIGRPFWDCPWWANRSEVQERIHSAFERAKHGEMVRADVEVHDRQGARLIMDLMFQPVFDQEHQLLFVIPSGVNVTDRKQVEEELAASQSFLKSALNALSSQIAVLDDKGTILAANRAWTEFAQDTVGDSLGREFPPFWPEGTNYLAACEAALAASGEEGQQAVAGIRDVVNGLQSTFSTVVSFQAAYEQYWFQLRVTQFSGTGPRRVVVAHENITAKAVADRAILRRSEQLQMLAEIAQQLSAASEVQEVLRVVTHGARALVGADEAEAIRFVDEGWTSALRCTSCADGWEPRIVAPAAEGDSIRIAVRTSGKPLRISPREWSEHPAYGLQLAGRTAPRGGCVVAPLSDQKARVFGLIQLCGKEQGDFSLDDEAMLVQLAQMAALSLERASLFEEIRVADHRKDEFLATLAHELRNPLSALTAGTQLIRMRPDKSAQVAESAELVMRQCNQLSRLVDDLLDVARISRGKLNLKMEEVCLQTVAVTALEIARPIVLDGRHQLDTQIPERQMYVRGDQARLSQVLANLLINSAKYTPPQGSIRLVMTEQENHATLEVFDNGIGIPEMMIERIFEKFTQVDGSHSRAQGGLGIGLTLAKTLVELHAGRIEVQSPPPQQSTGSVFRVRLPLIAVKDPEPAANPDSAAANTQLRSVSRRILVVDDNRAALYLLSQLLKSLNQTVETAPSGAEALKKMQEFRPDVLISDIGMPNMDGYELARQVRLVTEVSQPILVALTGYGQTSDRRAAVEAGFDFHLTKPVSLEQLTTLLPQLA